MFVLIISKIEVTFSSGELCWNLSLCGPGGPTGRDRCRRPAQRVPAAGAARAERRRMRSDRARSGHVVCGDLGSAGPTGRSVGIQRRLGQLFHRPDRPHRPHLPPRVRPFIVLCFRIIRSHSSNIYFIVLKCVCPARYSANLTRLNHSHQSARLNHSHQSARVNQSHLPARLNHSHL